MGTETAVNRLRTMIMDITALGLMDEEDIELDLAALTLSAADHDGVDIRRYVDLLSEIGTAVADAGENARNSDEQSEALADVFARRFGFSGDAETYDAPLNADMIRVLDRRRGLPISLSILYVAAARRIGWTAQALNTPGHVLVSVGASPATLIDPFSNGKVVTHQQLLVLLAHALGPTSGVQPHHVAPMSNRAVLVRLLLNQASRAEQEGDTARATTLYQRMTRVAPENGHGWWELARLQLVARDVDGARRSLSAMLEITRDPERREHVSAALEAISPR
ncbi:MAG: transglutaminase-like domain-containing protein [Sphingobium sp.]|uniref:SirB1 family protein n=1 Tax=Sphingobium sp. TaxID=1912891 RepID=UPI0029BC2073|nr:transglutaminase-like domain-containing protein [Sphingobium sp.]MDX3910237.1 transglutaminase-like domain-containing protein [Sphingobium sp.]